MNTLNMVRGSVSGRSVPYLGYFIFGVLLMLWPITQYFVMSSDQAAGYLDPNIWLLILMALICFLAIVGLAWFLLKQFWTSLGLPELGSMVLQFKKIELWQQLGFYWLSFALLLLAAVGVLVAII